MKKWILNKNSSSKLDKEKRPLESPVLDIDQHAHTQKNKQTKKKKLKNETDKKETSCKLMLIAYRSQLLVHSMQKKIEEEGAER